MLVYWLIIATRLLYPGIPLVTGMVLRFAMVPVEKSEPVKPPGITVAMASSKGQSRSVSAGKVYVGVVTLLFANLINEGARMTIS